MILRALVTVLAVIPLVLAGFSWSVSSRSGPWVLGVSGAVAAALLVRWGHLPAGAVCSFWVLAGNVWSPHASRQ